MFIFGVGGGWYQDWWASVGHNLVRQTPPPPPPSLPILSDPPSCSAFRRGRGGAEDWEEGTSRQAGRLADTSAHTGLLFLGMGLRQRGPGGGEAGGYYTGWDGIGGVSKGALG